MKSETTLKDIYLWLLSGKKITSNDFHEGSYVYLYNGMLLDEKNNETSRSFQIPSEWSLYQGQVEKVKWFRVTSFLKDNNRPVTADWLYESKDSFLKSEGYEEEDFHWITLEEVVYA